MNIIYKTEILTDGLAVRWKGCQIEEVHKI